MGFRLFGWRRRRAHPKEEGFPTHLMVVFENSPADRELLRSACMLADVLSAKLMVLCLVEVSRSTDLAQCPPEKLEAGECLAAAAREIGEENGYSDMETLVQATHNCGYTIVTVAKEQGCDLLMLSASYRGGRQMLSDTVETVLRKAPMQVCLYVRPEDKQR